MSRHHLLFSTAYLQLTPQSTWNSSFHLVRLNRWYPLCSTRFILFLLQSTFKNSQFILNFQWIFKVSLLPPSEKVWIQWPSLLFIYGCLILHLSSTEFTLINSDSYSRLYGPFGSSLFLTSICSICCFKMY